MKRGIASNISFRGAGPVVRVIEVFRSLQGESSRAGFPSLFIRLAGCNLNCVYCDTVYAREGGRDMPIRDLLKTAERCRGIDHITVTGGEPLLQENAIALMDALTGRGFSLRLETNGSLPIARVPEAVRKIVDVKTPSSGQAGSFLMDNLSWIGPGDEIKFVIGNRIDYTYSRRFIKKFLDKTDCIVNFSPVYGAVSPGDLAEWILRDRLTVRLNMQLHRILWPGDEPKTYR